MISRKIKLTDGVIVLKPVGNSASQRVAEKAGAVYEGVLRNKTTQNRRFVSAFMFSLVSGDLKK